MNLYKKNEKIYFLNLFNFNFSIFFKFKKNEKIHFEVTVKKTKIYEYIIFYLYFSIFFKLKKRKYTFLFVKKDLDL